MKKSVLVLTSWCGHAGIMTNTNATNHPTFARRVLAGLRSMHADQVRGFERLMTIDDRRA